MDYTKISSKGQVVIPRKIRDSLKLVDGEYLAVSTDNDGLIVLKRISPKLDKQDIEFIKRTKEAWKQIGQGGRKTYTLKGVYRRISPQGKTGTHLTIEIIKQRITPVLKEYGIKRAGIFGSYARGEQKQRSDVDILVTMPSSDFFAFVDLKTKLQKVLRRKVDLVEYSGIKPRIKNNILGDEIPIKL